MDTSALFKLTYGLFVVTSSQNGRDNGCITNTVMQLTSDPIRIAVSLNKANLTHDMIANTRRMNVSILSEQSTFDIFKHWGYQSGHKVDKTLGVSLSRTSNGIIYPTDGVNVVITANVTEQIDLGTHTLFIATVEDAFSLTKDSSVTYAYYQAHIKPATPSTKKQGWICTICGYIYEGENLPQDFICPTCHHLASDFEKIK